jgi:hypothetical protein
VISFGPDLRFIGLSLPGYLNRYTVHSYSIFRLIRGEAMRTGHMATSGSRGSAIAHWELLLQDETALLENPGRHHKALLAQAHALHRDQIINSDDLSDLLEQADGALAYAVETLIDCHVGDQAG